MNNENKNKLEEILRQDLDNYENFGFNDEQKAKALGIISKEAAVLLAEDKETRDSIRVADNSAREKERFEFEKEMRIKEYELKVEQLNLERQKFEDEWNQRVMDNTKAAKREKTQFWLSVAGVAAPLVLGIVKLCTYAGLTMNAQKHDYNDYQLESSSSKENRNNITK